MYDEIFEMIQESYNNGEITFEEAEELNEAAYEKYVLANESTEEETEEDLSVEEKCALINKYLEESGGAHQKYLDVTKKMMITLSNAIIF